MTNVKGNQNKHEATANSWWKENDFEISNTVYKLTKSNM